MAWSRLAGRSIASNWTAPLSEETVQAFERKHGCTLPDDFRRFVREAGGSGTGPYYGLLPIDRWWHDFGTDSLRPGADSPLYPGAPEEEESSRYCDGTIRLVELGCAHFAVLVVSGPYRGRVVYFIEGDHPYFTGDTSFLAWYERWLDEILAGWNTAWFGTGMPGDSARMVKVLTAPESTAEDRREALQTVSRMPKLDGELANAVLACLSDPDAKVREKSMWIAVKRRLRGVEPIARAQCRDDAPEVRMAALKALRDFQASDWAAQARLALADPDRDVCSLAMRLLGKARLITREELEPLINSPAANKRCSAIHTWGNARFKVSKAPWLEARIHDEDREVRRSVILAANRARDRAFVPRLREMAMREDGEFDALVANVWRSLLRWSLRWWIFWVTTIAVGALLFVYHPWAGMAWAAVAAYLAWRIGYPGFL